MLCFHLKLNFRVPDANPFGGFRATLFDRTYWPTCSRVWVGRFRRRASCHGADRSPMHAHRANAEKSAVRAKGQACRRPAEGPHGDDHPHDRTGGSAVAVDYLRKTWVRDIADFSFGTHRLAQGCPCCVIHARDPAGGPMSNSSGWATATSPRTQFGRSTIHRKEVPELPREGGRQHRPGRRDQRARGRRDRETCRTSATRGPRMEPSVIEVRAVLRSPANRAAGNRGTSKPNHSSEDMRGLLVGMLARAGELGSMRVG